MRCDEVRDLAPDIALGIADGEERAEALRHLATCDDCRHAVEQLSQVADELLLVAPVQEPPPGFESRVVKALGHGRPPRRRLVRRLTLRVGPALAAAAVTAAALIAVYSDDRQTAERYRETLEQAGGQSFQAQPMRDKTGERAGVAFGYQGRPSWMLVTVYPAFRDAVTSGELVTTDGRTIPLAGFELDRRQGTWGGAIPVDLHDVRSIRLLGDDPGEVLEASL
jgi:hypothetical protein